MWLMKLKDVVKCYGDVTALDHVNLEIKKGEILTVVGPNGSGKTTMLRIMAFIDEPTSGEIYFDGVPVNNGNRSKVRVRTTMVFQTPVLFNTTVYKNIAYGLKLRGYPKKDIDKRVREVLRLVKLEGYENRPAKRLSGGEQQRVALSRALVLDTELLLLDEPTANLDPKNVSIIEETLSHVNRELGTTMVIATHNMFQAESLADRVALLIGGRLKGIGTPIEVFGMPSRSLASFARLENVFSGVSEILEGGTSLVDVGDGVRIEATIRRSGKVTIFVRPSDIIVSKQPIRSSARNVFRGKIVEISDLGSIMKLKVDAGKRFIIQITKRSFREMKLNIHSKVYIAFKASSVSLV